MPDRTNHPRRRVLQVAAAAAASLALPLRAQSGFPSGPLRIIVGVPAGGAADVGMRALAAVLEKNLKQTVIVENRTGGGFMIAWQALQAAPADGHTLMHTTNSFAALHAVQKQFDMEKQVAHISVTSTSPIALIVNGDSPFKTLGEMAAYGRANPDKLSYGTTGVGTAEHLKLTQFERIAGFKGLAVPFRGGPDAVQALMSGTVSFLIILCYVFFSPSLCLSFCRFAEGGSTSFERERRRCTNAGLGSSPGRGAAVAPAPRGA